MQFESFSVFYILGSVFMINQATKFNNNNNLKAQSFRGSSATNGSPATKNSPAQNASSGLNPADNFLVELEKINKKQNGGFLSKYLWSITALLSTGIPLNAYVFGTYFRLKHFKKQNNQPAFDSLFNSYSKNIKFVIAGGIALFIGLQYFFNSQNDKNYKKLQEKFNEINTTTGAKLNGTFRSTYAGAYCNSASGNIQINRNLMNDPISRQDLLKTIRHELVHAKQFEMIARSKDGIKKLNYANVIQVVRTAEKNPETVNDFKDIYKTINEDTSGKYDNVKININGDTYDFKKYIEAINILLTNKKATYNDIPIIIDEAHYQKIISEKGGLTPEEEELAGKYYKALSDYEPVSLFNAFNPFGSYRKNILEVEAYKENPSLFTRLCSCFAEKEKPQKISA